MTSLIEFEYLMYDPSFKKSNQLKSTRDGPKRISLSMMNFGLILDNECNKLTVHISFEKNNQLMFIDMFLILLLK